MGLQLLFCVEADRKSGTDWVYIKSVIDKYFSIDNSISIKPVYMGGKTNFKRNKVVNEINRASKEFGKNGETAVIYCIDTDDWNTNQDRSRELEDVREYCADKKYDLVWFCRDVEEVFWGERVSSSDKKERAKKFRANSKIDTLTQDCIKSETFGLGKSNILIILNKYLKDYQCSELVN